MDTQFNCPPQLINSIYKKLELEVYVVIDYKIIGTALPALLNGLRRIG
jgi:hypothetical protein